ncbi:MAG: hypothetical protein AB7F40_11455 [Victivallaceae bacterium]
MGSNHESDWLELVTVGNDYDPPQIFGRKIQTAAKDYSCDWQGCDQCHGIQKGERYMKESGATNCGVITQRYCAACMEDATEWMRDEDE